MLNSTYQITIARSVPEVRRLESVWNQVIKSTTGFDVNAQIDHYLLVNEHFKAKPYVLFIEKDNTPKALMIGRIDRAPVDLTIGYSRIGSTKANICTFICGGVNYTQEPEVCDIITQQLLDLLKNNSIDLLRFTAHDNTSMLFSKLAVLKRVAISKPQKHHKLELWNSFENFLNTRSKNHRKNLRYYANKLQNDYNNKVRVEKYTSKEQVKNLLDSAEMVAQKTYQRGMQVGFKNNELTKQRFQLAAEKGWLRSYILFIEDKPVTFQMGFQFNCCYHVQGKGYLPEFEDYRVGTYLFMHILKEMIEDSSISLWDFGLGDAEYKDSYSTNFVEECSVSIYSCSIKGIFLYYATSVEIFLKSSLEFILRRINFDKKLKKMWRKLLIPSSEKKQSTIK